MHASSGVGFVPVPEPDVVAHDLAGRTGALLIVGVAAGREAIERRARAAAARRACQRERAERARLVAVQLEVCRLAGPARPPGPRPGQATDAALRAALALEQAEAARGRCRRGTNRVLALANGAGLVLLLAAVVLLWSGDDGAGWLLAWLVVGAGLCPLVAAVVCGVRVHRAGRLVTERRERLALALRLAGATSVSELVHLGDRHDDGAPRSRAALADARRAQVAAEADHAAALGARLEAEHALGHDGRPDDLEPVVVCDPEGLLTALADLTVDVPVVVVIADRCPLPRVASPTLL